MVIKPCERTCAHYRIFLTIHLLLSDSSLSCRQILESSIFLRCFVRFLMVQEKNNPKTVYTPKYCKKTLRRNDPDILTPFVIIITGILTLITSSSLSRILSRSVSKCMYDVNSDLYPVIIVCMRFRCVHNHRCDFQGLHDEWLQLWQK